MKGSCTEAEFRTGASRAIETRDLHAQVGYIRDRNGPRDGDDLCSIWVYAVTHTQIVQAIISIDNRQTTLGRPRSVHRIPVTNVLFGSFNNTLEKLFKYIIISSGLMVLSREMPSGKHARILSRRLLLLLLGFYCCCLF